MKRKAISVLTAIAIVMTLIPFGAVIGSAEDGLQSSNDGLTLSSGTYYVNSDITISNSTVGGSGITIEPNSTVNIYIPADYSLTAKGADGKGTVGGGAGIWLPSSSTLNVYGGGTISAFGGKAGDGADGGNGGKHPERLLDYIRLMFSWIVSGTIKVNSTGGEGGAGGGGAGAGIGTPGANGPDGGLGGFTATYTHKEDGKNVTEKISDIDGKSGEDAVSADTMGTLISDDVSFKARGGAGGAGGFGGSASNFSMFGLVSVGAGGGGGGGGYAAASIGSGGNSGASGGGGGTSPYDAKESYYDYGGVGGEGNSDGFEGDTTKTSAKKGGIGGAGGIGGEEGKAKSFKINYNLASGEKLPSGSAKSYTYAKGVTLPEPVKSGYEFVGWHMDENLESDIVTKIGLREAGNKNFYAEWKEIIVLTPPEITVNEDCIVLNENDYDVANLSLCYIGKYEKSINDWNLFAGAGLQFTNVNGTEGYKQYESPENGMSVQQSKTGYYAACINYLADGVETNIYQVVYLNATEVLPEVQVSENNIVVVANDYTVDKVSLCYIGTETKEINDWDSFAKAGLQFKNINSSTGYKQYASPKDGLSIPQTTTGYYAAYIRYIENGVKVIIYQVVYLENEKAVPEVETSENNIVLNANGYTIDKVSLCYIGNENKEINDWDSFAKAGLQFKNINSSIGYKQYASPKDGLSLPQDTEGYYAVYIRYIDNGEKFIIYQVIYVTTKKDLPEVKVSENNIVLNANGYSIDKLSLCYIGAESKEIKDWDSFAKAGLQYKNKNSSIGYLQYASPKDGLSLPQDTEGYYAAYIRYIDNGEKFIIYQVIYVTAKKDLPEVVTSENNIVLNANGFTIDKLSLCYIGTESKEIKDWDSFANAGLQYKNKNSSIGYLQYASPKDGLSLSQDTEGYYAAYIRYIDNGEKFIIYQTIFIS